MLLASLVGSLGFKSTVLNMVAGMLGLEIAQIVSTLNFKGQHL